MPDDYEWPDVTIVICTYNRYKTIRKTMAALIKYLDYPKDKIHVLIADDHTGDDYLERLSNLKDFNHWHTGFIETPENCGWGCNVNYALSQVATDYVFFLEDDYVLTIPLDLRIGVAMLEVSDFMGMIRYRGTAGGHYILHHLEANLGKFLPDHRQGNGGLVNGRVTYCLLDNASPSLYIYTHGPHLKRLNFHSGEHYGMYPEGLKLGATEETYAKHVKNRMKEAPNQVPAIAILPEWITMQWDHIGKSYQHSEWDD